VRQVLVQQFQRERLQRLGRGGHLGQDVDAVLVLLDHPLQAPDLPLDPAQPLEVAGLLGAVPVDVLLGHGGLSLTYGGYQ
jgi:hypothetical protein